MHILLRPQAAGRKSQAFPVIRGSIKAASRKRQLLHPDHPRTHKLEQGRKPASPQAHSDLHHKKQKRPQALRRKYRIAQGRKASPLPYPPLGREKLSNQTLDPLCEGAGAIPPTLSLQIQTFF